MKNEKIKNFVSVVVYVRNSEKEIEHFLGMIYEFLSDFEKREIICVDDDSSDNSVNEIKRIAKNYKDITLSIVHMSYFQGLEPSMNAGIDFSIGDFVFEFDSTITDYEANILYETYNKAMEGYDIVSVSPNKNSGTFTNFYYSIFNHFGNFDYNVKTERFRIVSRRVINRIGDYNKSKVYRKALYATSGLCSYSLFYSLKIQKSAIIDKELKRYQLDLGINSLIIFTNVGYLFCLFMSISMILLSIGMVIYSLLFKLLNKPVAGWASTILFMSVGFCGIFIVLLVVVKYLQIILDMQIRRKKYNFSSLEKIN